MAATAALTTTGQKASVAQTQLKSAIIAITAPTKDMSKVIRSLGIAGVKSGKDLIDKKGLVGAMQLLSKAA